MMVTAMRNLEGAQSMRDEGNNGHLLTHVEMAEQATKRQLGMEQMGCLKMGRMVAST